MRSSPSSTRLKTPLIALCFPTRSEILPTAILLQQPTRPPPKSFDELLAAQKTPDATLLVAPLATDKSKPSYELLLADKRLSSITNPAQTIAIRSLYTFKDGGYLAAFADGHVEILDGKAVNPEQAPH